MTSDAVGRRTLRKVIWRLVPYLALLSMFNIIDRANVSFARLGMVKDVGFSDSVIDWGSYGSHLIPAHKRILWNQRIRRGAHAPGAGVSCPA